MLRGQTQRNSPIILAQSGVASSVTGTVAETTLATVTIPGGMLGANGRLRIKALASVTNNANNKVVNIKLGGVQLQTTTLTTSISLNAEVSTFNRASPSSQVTNGSVNGTSGAANTVTTLNTSSDLVLTINGILTNIADTITLEGYTVEVLPS